MLPLFRREACFPEMRSTKGSQFTRRLFISPAKPELMKAKASFRTPKTEFRNRHYLEGEVKMSEDKVACAVCKKEIPRSVALTVEGSDYIHYFCCHDCLNEFFLEHPDLKPSE